MTERITLHLDEVDSDGDHGVLGRFRGRCAVANGCFDVWLHPGHLAVLATLDTEAYKRGLRPIVALNSDASVRFLKGFMRPHVPDRARAALINNLKWPLTVVIFDEETPQRLMDILRPQIVVKGREYDPKNVVRWKDSEVVGVTMVDGWSSSKILGDTR
jgi:rfaE bifunctional protein nucleotidyltransferase chain/domain